MALCERDAHLFEDLIGQRDARIVQVRHHHARGALELESADGGHGHNQERRKYESKLAAKAHQESPCGVSFTRFPGLI